MRFAYWITSATNAHSEYAVLIAFPRQQLLGERASILCDTYIVCFVNLLKPTGHVMYQQFNIQQLYALPTLYLCVLYLSENKQRLVPLTA